VERVFWGGGGEGISVLIGKGGKSDHRFRMWDGVATFASMGGKKREKTKTPESVTTCSPTKNLSSCPEKRKKERGKNLPREI